ncbi:MAG: hypothetical protein AAGM38_04000 [Pseudomonadota bacterium]
MSTVFLLIGHQLYPFAPGRRRGAYLERAQAFFTAAGHESRLTGTAETFDVEAENDAAAQLRRLRCDNAPEHRSGSDAHLNAVFAKEAAHV